MSDIAQFRTTRPHMLKASKEYASQTLMGGLSGFEMMGRIRFWS